jgi:hypothetical protein
MRHVPGYPSIDQTERSDRWSRGSGSSSPLRRSCSCSCCSAAVGRREGGRSSSGVPPSGDAGSKDAGSRVWPRDRGAGITDAAAAPIPRRDPAVTQDRVVDHRAFVLVATSAFLLGMLVRSTVRERWSLGPPTQAHLRPQPDLAIFLRQLGSPGARRISPPSSTGGARAVRAPVEPVGEFGHVNARELAVGVRQAVLVHGGFSRADPPHQLRDQGRDRTDRARGRGDPYDAAGRLPPSGRPIDGAAGCSRTGPGPGRTCSMSG